MLSSRLRRTRAGWVGALLLSLALSLAMPVLAQARPAARGLGRKAPLLPFLRLDGHLALGWEGAVGVGARAEVPLVTTALRYSVRDELALGVGADVTFSSLDGSRAVTGYPTVVLQWSVGINDRFAFFSELGLAGSVDDDGWRGLHPNLGFGARCYLQRSFGLSARFGWPIALSAGAVF